MSKRKVIYLASPYTHRLSRIRAARYEQICMVAYNLIEKNSDVYFVPIPMSHAIERETMAYSTKPRLGWATWMSQDFELLSRCDELCVICLPGYKDSKGVAAEIKFAKDRDIPVTYIEGAELEELLGEEK